MGVRTPGPGLRTWRSRVGGESLRRSGGRHLAMIDDLVPWEDFRPVLETVWRKPKRERRSAAGRKPWDAVLMSQGHCPGCVAQSVRRGARARDRGRLTFMPIPGPRASGPDAGRHVGMAVPGTADAQAGIVEELFDRFDSFLRARGYEASLGGQIVDASIVEVPRQRNRKEEDARIKAGEVPEGGPRVLLTGWRQKDLDARWTKKGGVSYYGYTANHVSRTAGTSWYDATRWTEASVHDSQMIGEILDPDNTAAKVWADKAYRAGGD